MEIFNVLKTGETTFIGRGMASTVKDALKNEDVLIVIDDDARLIWLWKGNTSSVAKKFVGARISQDIRGQRGLTYKVIPVDQDDEPEEFKQIYNSELAETPQEKARPPIAEGAAEEVVAVSQTLSEEMKNTLTKEPLPGGFEREAIILGQDFYGVVKSVAKVLGKEVINETIQKTTELPDGVLFDTSYGLRFLIKNGNVTAIEILKRS